MRRITPSKIINTQALRELDSGQGRWLDEKFQVRTMSRFRRLCMHYAPKLFMPRKNKAAIRRLYRSLSSYKIDHKAMGLKRAALLLAKANLVDIIKKGKRLDIKPKALLDKQKLDTVIESSDKTDDTLMDEIVSPLPSDLLGQKRRRSPSLSRTDSIEGPTPSKQSKTIRSESEPMDISPPVTPQVTEGSRKRKNMPPISQQVASPSDELSRYEDKLFTRVKSRYCQNREQYAVLRNAFFALNDFEKELNDEDFVKLVNKGTLYEFNEHLLLSWEDNDYRREAADIMVKLGKRESSVPAPSTSTPPTAPVAKKPVPYALWCSRENSYNPLVYALRVTKSDSCIEDDFIKGALTTFIADKLQSGFNMTVEESTPAARALLKDIGLNPGDEKTATYGQISSIGVKIKWVGGKHLESHPKITVKPAPAPKLAAELPQNIQASPEHAQVYDHLKKAKLIDKTEFVALEAMEPRVLTNDLFHYQLAVYNWLEPSGEFSRDDFVKSIQQGLLNSGITTQLLKARDAKERPENWARKLKARFYSPPTTRPTTSAKVNTPVNQPETRAQSRTREHVAAVEMRPETAPLAAGKLPSIQYLLNRKGMPNFGCTCYFNSVCQQLSLAIPPETMRELASKQIPNKYAAEVRNEFINLMNLVNGEYPDVKTRQQHQALEQRFATAQGRLLNACYQHGQQVSGSRFRATLPHNRLKELDQEDSSEFFVAISDTLKLNDHLSNALQEATHITLKEGGKSYTYKRSPNVADTLLQVKLPDDVDNGQMNLQSCVHAMKDTMPLYREWSEDEAKHAGYPNPSALNRQHRNSSRDIVKVSADVSQLRSLTFHSNLTDGYYDRQTMQYTNRKLTERGRRVLADGATKVKQSVFDLKTGKTVDVDLSLQSVVVHQGNSLRSGHYTTIVRSQEGPWVLFNDSQPVAQYSTLNAYLAEDKYRTPYLLNYRVTEPVRP